MRALLRARTALCLPVVGVLLVALTPPASASVSAPAPAASPAASPAVAKAAAKAKARASLRVSPRTYVGGQAVTFRGYIGKPGKRRIHLQTHFARPGDKWTTLPGSTRRTAKSGRFRFAHPAPSMFGIRMRVVSGRLKTRGVTFNAKSQDVAISYTGAAPVVGPGEVLAGEQFTIRADTTPTTPKARPDLPPPPIPGRRLLLQQQVSGLRWQTIDTTRTNSVGNGSFSVRAPGAPGGAVYRVREEAWTVGANEIGWFPSFPMALDVVTARGTGGRTVAIEPSRRATAPARAAAPQRAPGSGAAVPTAAGAHKWGRSLWDFAWEFGESLSSRPYRGTDRRGWWLDASDGSGRAAKQNGGLGLDSQRGVDGPGDRGSTWVTLQDNPMAYGRWEMKMRLNSPERNAGDYRIRIELVPDRTSDYHCGAQNIRVADFATHGSTLTVGAKSRSGNAEWTYRKSMASLIGRSAAFAVEVSRSHISWFLNGRVVATVKSTAAVSDVPLTMRITLAGDGQQEMNRTTLISDWQRGYSLSRGRATTNGHSLSRSTHDGGC